MINSLSATNYFSCTKCNKKFASKYDFNRHLAKSICLTIKKTNNQYQDKILEREYEILDINSREIGEGKKTFDTIIDVDPFSMTLSIEI